MLFDNIYAYKENSGRFVGEDGSFINIADGDLEIKSKRHDIIKLEFGDTNVLNIDEDKTYTSKIYGIDKYKSLEMFVKHSVSGGINLFVTPSIEGNSMSVVSFFDWNTEQWARNTLGENNRFVQIPLQQQVIFPLTTHPDLYWLKDLKARNIQVRLEPNNFVNTNGNVEVWLVGELNG